MPMTSRSISCVLLRKLLSWNGSPTLLAPVAQEGQQSRVVEGLVAGVADEPVSQLLKVAQKARRGALGLRLGLASACLGGGWDVWWGVCAGEHLKCIQELGLLCQARQTRKINSLHPLDTKTAKNSAIRGRSG